MAGQPSPPAQQHTERAAEYAQRGELKSAESELRQALELSPNDPALLTSLGGILGMEGDLKQANVYLSKAVKLNPQDALLRRNLAANQWQLGQFREAHQNLERLIRANPQDKHAIFLLGMVSENQKDYARSIALLESIPEITERQPEARVALASAYFRSNRAEEARQTVRELLHRPVDPRIMFTAGRVAMDAHDYSLAETVFTSLRSAYPDPAVLEFQIALAQYRDRRVAQSERTLTEAVAANRANQDSYVLLSQILAGRGDPVQALKVAARGSQAFPNSSNILSAKAAIEMKLQYFGDAVASNEKAARLNPLAAGVRRDLAVAEWRAGMRERSEASFRDAIRQFPGDAETYLAYAVLLLEEGSPDARSRAIQLLGQALARDDSSIEARYQLANIALEDGKPEQALAHLEFAVKRDPQASRVRYALSRTYQRLGRSSDADREMEMYQKLKAAQPSDVRSDSPAEIH